jgi:hypothetical protein
MNAVDADADAMNAEPTARSGRNGLTRWRFSLRAALVVMLLFAITFAGFGWRLRRAQKQAATIEKIHATGIAKVEYDYQMGQSSNVPRWARNWLGDDFFSDVHRLGIRPKDERSTAPPDGWKEPIGARGVSARHCEEVLVLATSFSQIRSLSIRQAVVHKELLERLTCWEQLTHIEIDGCDIRDEDLEPLSRAINVRSVELNRQPIGDRSLAYLRNMSQLTELELGVTNVTDDGLVVLDSFPHLQELSLWDTRTSNRGMAHVGRCRELQTLALAATAVGDDGVREVGRLSELRILDLSATQVTDEGVKHLAPLANLDQAMFLRTAVTQAGIDQVPSLVKSKNYLLDKPVNTVTTTDDAAPGP